jgi:molybdopterin-guanine dinucleotide biosynthesis protein A
VSAELYGLVLAGGQSRRMQRDKASLEYAGETQLARAMRLLTPLVVRSFVSVRADQLHEPNRAAYEPIVDALVDAGPIGGIQAALRDHPDRAWLVLACDLPFLDADTLRHLVRARAPQRLATAYRSSIDGKPEPLCAIFEPASGSAIEAWIASGRQCPRSFLAQADVLLLEPINPRALDNINTAPEYADARAALEAPARRLNVRYFAILREQAGRGAEEVHTRARTPRELYEELRCRHGLKIAPEFLRVAVNEEFGEWTQPLAEGDSVVFLPPVAGG